jgi:hypothetical protein
MNKTQRAVKGKVIQELVEDSYYGVVSIRFHDGSYLMLTPFENGIHNDRWLAIMPTYFDGESDE